MPRPAARPVKPVHPAAGTWPVRFGAAALLADTNVPGGWLLEVDGIPQSYVHPDDPEYLEFAYVQLIADVVELSAPAGEPLSVLHLGGGGCTLPRYLAHTRPGSTQLVLEADDLLVEIVRRELGTAGFRLKVGDARDGLSALRPASSDLVISDVFTGARLPVACTTLEYVERVRALLAPGGTYVANVADGPPLAFARGQVATLLAVFPHVAMLADPSVLRGRRFGNIVLAGSAAPFDAAGLARRAARASGRARVVLDDEVRAFAGGAKPVTDSAAVQAPLPPVGLFTRGAH